jgi:2,5-furandicarboxylate decarboxylase 1
MVYQDLRAFLVDISRPIALKYDVATALAKSNSVQGPALMFRETGTAFPLVDGLYATRKRALLAFDATEASLHDRVLKGIDNPIGPVDFEGAPPCQEVMLTGEQIDLTKLPVPSYSPKDGGPYITAGIVISENPETSIPDIGNYRFQIHGPKEMGLFAASNHRFGKNIAKATEMKVPLHGAIVVGVDPMIAFSCQVQSSDATNDWFVAGGLRGSAVELVKAVVSDLKVPAHSEFVIEFTVETTDQRMKGSWASIPTTTRPPRPSRRPR